MRLTRWQALAGLLGISMGGVAVTADSPNRLRSATCHQVPASTGTAQTALTLPVLPTVSVTEAVQVVTEQPVPVPIPSAETLQPGLPVIPSAGGVVPVVAFPEVATREQAPAPRVTQDIAPMPSEAVTQTPREVALPIPVVIADAPAPAPQVDLPATPPLAEVQLPTVAVEPVATKAAVLPPIVPAAEPVAQVPVPVQAVEVPAVAPAPAPVVEAPIVSTPPAPANNPVAGVPQMTQVPHEAPTQAARLGTEEAPKSAQIQLWLGDGKPRFAVFSQGDILLKVLSDSVEVKAPSEQGEAVSTVVARGNVQISAPGCEATCKLLIVNPMTGEVRMEQDVVVKCRQGKGITQFTASQMSFQLGSAPAYVVPDPQGILPTAGVTR